MNDPISDMLTRIRNGYLAHLTSISMPYSVYKEKLGQILVRGGYAKSIVIVQDGKVKRNLTMTLSYAGRTPELTNITRVSKPSVKVYVSKRSIPRVLGGLGQVVISTSKGLMLGDEARKLGLGGEIICKIW